MQENTIIRDQWYVAARADEVTDAPLGRWICNEPLVMFRDADGRAVALTDRCPHRKYPLSKGSVADGQIECGYHGLRFDGTGACTLIPSQKTGFEAFKVRTYPVVEAHDLIFVWTGAPERADASMIVDWSHNTKPGWTVVHGYHYVEGNYQLMLDNVLDLSHVTFVHKSTLNSPQVPSNPVEVEIDGDVVSTLRISRDCDPPPLWRTARGFKGQIDRWQGSTFYPPCYLFGDMKGVDAGTNDLESGLHYIVLNCFTPETEHSTHYFWSVSRCFAQDDPEISAAIKKGIQAAFDEDCEVIAAQQKMIDTDPLDTPLAFLQADKAVAAMRRIIARQLSGEESREAP